MRRILMLVIVCLLMLGRAILNSQDGTPDAIVNLVNQERQALGLRPLYVNMALVQAAQRHSNDMAQGDFLSHTGSDGSSVLDRVVEAGYPMMTAAENVQSRNNLDPAATFQLWWNSPSHRENMINPAYSEIGIAYAPSVSGTYYFTMVLANRADFIAPPQSNVTSTDLIISAIAPSTPPSPPTLVLTSATSPTTTLVSSTDMALSTTQSPSIAAPIQDANTVAMNEIRLQGILSLLIDQTGALGAVLQPTPTNTAVEQITVTLVSEPQDDVLLVYDADSFSIVNTAARSLYLEGLYFESPSGSLSIDRWNTEFLSASLTQFPSRGCLQVWGLGYAAPLAAPDACGIRHGWIAVNDSSTFWQNTSDFFVYVFGEPVTMCSVSMGECSFNLSDRVNNEDIQALPEQTVSQPTVYPGDIRLIYSTDSFTILNTSGNNLDMTGLGFSSASGIVPISQWDTQFLSRPLDDFPNGDCLQAWSLSLAEWPSRPADCRLRHAWIGLAESQLFWTTADFFTVSRDGVVLATCSVNAGVCDVDLP